MKLLTFLFDVLATSVAGDFQIGDQSINCGDLNKHNNKIVFLGLQARISAI
jgi:hypothetical protein